MFKYQDQPKKSSSYTKNSQPDTQNIERNNINNFGKGDGKPSLIEQLPQEVFEYLLKYLDIPRHLSLRQASSTLNNKVLGYYINRSRCRYTTPRGQSGLMQFFRAEKLLKSTVKNVKSMYENLNDLINDANLAKSLVLSGCLGQVCTLIEYGFQIESIFPELKDEMTLPILNLLYQYKNSDESLTIYQEPPNISELGNRSIKEFIFILNTIFHKQNKMLITGTLKNIISKRITQDATDHFLISNGTIRYNILCALLACDIDVANPNLLSDLYIPDYIRNVEDIVSDTIRVMVLTDWYESLHYHETNIFIEKKTELLSLAEYYDRKYQKPMFDDFITTITKLTDHDCEECYSSDDFLTSFSDFNDAMNEQNTALKRNSSKALDSLQDSNVSFLKSLRM